MSISSQRNTTNDYNLFLNSSLASNYKINNKLKSSDENHCSSFLCPTPSPNSDILPNNHGTQKIKYGCKTTLDRIDLNGCVLIIYYCTFSNIIHNGDGGAIFIQIKYTDQEGDISINECVFRHCQATNGGAIYIKSIEVTRHFGFFKCKFHNNVASSVGGSLYLEPTYCTVDGCQFIDNSAIMGADICYYIVSHIIQNNRFCTIQNNKFIKFTKDKTNSLIHLFLQRKSHLRFSQNEVKIKHIENMYLFSYNPIHLNTTVIYITDNCIYPSEDYITDDEFLKSKIDSASFPNVCDPIEESVPISVGIREMKVSNFDGYCSEKDCDNNKIDLEEKCGKSCVASNANYEYTFKGERFGIYGTKDPSYSFFEISLDGELITTYDECYYCKDERVILYKSDVLKYGEHTIKVSGKNQLFEIYKFVFWPSIEAYRINSTDFNTTGNWIVESDFIGGLREQSNEYGASKFTIASFQKIWFYGSKDINYGLVSLEFSNQSYIINESNSIRIDQALLFESKLFEFPEYFLSINPSSLSVFYCIYYIQGPPIPIKSSSIEFSQSNEFSLSNAFLPSNQFSKSNQFSQSNEYSKSNQFSQSNQFSNSNEFSISDEYLISKINSQYQILSDSIITLPNKNIKSITFSESGSIQLEDKSKPFDSDHLKNKIPKGALIGIVCGILSILIISATVLIFFILRKKKSQNYEESSASSSSENDEKQNDQIVHRYGHNDRGLDIWF